MRHVALALLALVACGKASDDVAADHPDRPAVCRDACGTALARLELRDQSLADQCAKACVARGFDEACLYTAKSADDIVACAHKADQKRLPPLAWVVNVDPPVVSTKREVADVTVAVTNNGKKTVDPMYRTTAVTLDGKPSPALKVFITDDLGAEWFELHVGATASVTRAIQSFALAPGDHVIALGRDGQELASATLHVTP